MYVKFFFKNVGVHLVFNNTFGSVKSNSLPVILPVPTLEGTPGECPSEVSSARGNYSEEIKQILSDTVIPACAEWSTSLCLWWCWGVD